MSLNIESHHFTPKSQTQFAQNHNKLYGSLIQENPAFKTNTAEDTEAASPVDNCNFKSLTMHLFCQHLLALSRVQMKLLVLSSAEHQMRASIQILMYHSHWTPRLLFAKFQRTSASHHNSSAELRSNRFFQVVPLFTVKC